MPTSWVQRGDADGNFTREWPKITTACTPGMGLPILLQIKILKLSKNSLYFGLYIHFVLALNFGGPSGSFLLIILEPKNFNFNIAILQLNRKYF